MHRDSLFDDSLTAKFSIAVGENCWLMLVLFNETVDYFCFEGTFDGTAHILHPGSKL